MVGVLYFGPPYDYVLQGVAVMKVRNFGESSPTKSKIGTTQGRKKGLDIGGGGR